MDDFLQTKFSSNLSRMQMEIILFCEMYLESMSLKMVDKSYVDNNSSWFRY